MEITKTGFKKFCYKLGLSCAMAHTLWMSCILAVMWLNGGGVAVVEPNTLILGLELFAVTPVAVLFVFYLVYRTGGRREGKVRQQ